MMDRLVITTALCVGACGESERLACIGLESDNSDIRWETTSHYDQYVGFVEFDHTPETMRTACCSLDDADRWVAAHLVLSSHGSLPGAFSEHQYFIWNGLRVVGEPGGARFDYSTADRECIVREWRSSSPRPWRCAPLRFPEQAHAPPLAAVCSSTR